MTKNNRLKAARVFVGLTQKQLAEKVGIEEINISRFETGRAEPGDELKHRIAQELNKEVMELFMGWGGAE